MDHSMALKYEKVRMNPMSNPLIVVNLVPSQKKRFQGRAAWRLFLEEVSGPHWQTREDADWRNPGGRAGGGEWPPTAATRAAPAGSG